jgi:hypothetical protein
MPSFDVVIFPNELLLSVGSVFSLGAKDSRDQRRGENSDGITWRRQLARMARIAEDTVRRVYLRRRAIEVISERGTG